MWVCLCAPVAGLRFNLNRMPARTTTRRYTTHSCAQHILLFGRTDISNTLVHVQQRVLVDAANRSGETHRRCVCCSHSFGQYHGRESLHCYRGACDDSDELRFPREKTTIRNRNTYSPLSHTDCKQTHICRLHIESMRRTEFICFPKPTTCYCSQQIVAQIVE